MMRWRLEKKKSSLILGEAYKISDFDSILRQKVVGSSLEESKSLDFENAFDDRLNAIISDLSNLKSLLSAGIPGGNQELDVLTKLQMIGFRKKLLDNVGIKTRSFLQKLLRKKLQKHLFLESPQNLKIQVYT